MKHLDFKKIGVFFVLSFSPLLVFASAKVQEFTIWNWVLHNIVFILALIVVVGALASVWNLFLSIIAEKKRELNIEEVSNTNSFSLQNFIKTSYHKLSGLIPLQNEKDILLDHNYDGIKELDNSLPPWWLYGFYVTIFIGFAYLYVFHYSNLGHNQVEEYYLAMEIGEKEKAAYAKRQANNIDEENLIALTDEASLSIAKKEFISKCSACHGKEGQGGVGPNLTDAYWIHGGSTPAIYKTIKYGVPEKGMIAWKSQLNPASIHKLASYVKTLQGTNPPNQKKQEGSFYEDTSVNEALGSIN